MGQPQSRQYKRSWKNLLINKDYQLRMTMVLVGVSALLMTGLGWWVMSQARTATEVAINNVAGTRCDKPAPLQEHRVVVDEITDMQPGGTDVVPVDDEHVAVPDDLGAAEAADPAADPGAAGSSDQGAAGDEAASGDPAAGTDGVGGERERPHVTITTSDMELQPKASEPEEPPAVDASEHRAQEQRYHECLLAKKAKVEDLHAGEKLIRRVLFGLGLLLVVGLAAYGIKMTHKVAGPLFKISLYLNKLKNGTYDTVYNLRKGDHLVEFYEHFKRAHAGVKAMVEEDIEHLRAVIEAADAAKLAETSPEVAEALEALRKELADKERSLG